MKKSISGNTTAGLGEGPTFFQEGGPEKGEPSRRREVRKLERSGNGEAIGGAT